MNIINIEQKKKMYLPVEIWEKIWRHHKRIIFEYTRQYLEKELVLPKLELVPGVGFRSALIGEYSYYLYEYCVEKNGMDYGFNIEETTLGLPPRIKSCIKSFQIWKCESCINQAVNFINQTVNFGVLVIDYNYE